MLTWEFFAILFGSIFAAFVLAILIYFLKAWHVMVVEETLVNRDKLRGSVVYRETIHQCSETRTRTSTEGLPRFYQNTHSVDI